MSKRVPASARTRKRIEELMDGMTGSADARSEFVKLATRLLLEESGEAEARDAVGREYYRHGEGHGHRNGYRTARLQSVEGPIEFAVPQVRGLRGWRSQVRECRPDHPGRRTADVGQRRRVAVPAHARLIAVNAARPDAYVDCGRAALAELRGFGGLGTVKWLIFMRRPCKGLHYTGCAVAAWAAVILGGGCAGNSRLSRSSKSVSSGSGCV